MTSFQEEFADYPPDTMPAIPEDWTDTSWHNDTCPSFSTPSGFTIYIDYLDPALREFPTECLTERFSVLHCGDDTPIEFLANNDWEKVLAFVKDPIAALTEEYSAWLRLEIADADLHFCAFDLMHCYSPIPEESLITLKQRNWLENFSKRWSIAADE